MLFLIFRNSYSGKFDSYISKPITAKSTIQRLESYKSPNVSVRRADALNVLSACERRPKTVLYLDPPYLFSDNRDYYASRQGHDIDFHTKLCDLTLSCQTPFILSINDTPEIRKLYGRSCIITAIPKSYRFLDAMNEARYTRKNELLIFGPKAYWHRRGLKPGKRRTGIFQRR